MLSRKQSLAIAGIVVVAAPLIGIALQLLYWDSIDWDLVSLSIGRLILSVVGNIAYLSVLYFSRNKVTSLWLIGLAWLAFNLFTLSIKATQC